MTLSPTIHEFLMGERESDPAKGISVNSLTDDLRAAAALDGWEPLRVLLMKRQDEARAAVSKALEELRGQGMAAEADGKWIGVARVVERAPQVVQMVIQLGG